MRSAIFFAVFVTLASCGSPPVEDVDAGASPIDAGPLRVDAGPDDAGTLSDAGASSDAGLVDAGQPVDAGTVDSGTPLDSGVPDAGGAVDSGVADAGLAVDAGSRADAGCLRVFCYTGAPDRNAGSNQPFGDLCDTLNDAGLVRDCVGSTCYSSFNTFLVSTNSVLYPKVFAALDTNQDNVVNSSDRQCRTVFIGYSWGGVASIDLATTLNQDSRVALSQRVVEVIALDPYQPGYNGLLDVPGNVRVFTEFRHTLSPSGDCSASAPLGPYRGLQPRCRTTSLCTDYDYSLSPMAYFPRYTTLGYTGQNIGHCEVPEVTHGPVRNLLRGQAPTPVPMTRPITNIP